MSAKIQFCVFEKKHDEPSGSGFCQKLETFFRVCDLKDYEVKFTTQFSAPKGKLPYIILEDGKSVADSHFVIRHLIKEGRVRDLDAGLTPAQRAESRAWQGYIEELIYPAIVWTRFAYPENLAILRTEVFQNVPFGLRQFLLWFVPRRIQSALIAHGVGRHTREEIDGLIEEYVTSLIARLEEAKAKSGENYFFHGTSPTISDCIIYGFLANGLRMKSNQAFIKLILASDLLREYVARGTRLWFPEYTKILEMVTESEGSTSAPEGDSKSK